MTLRGANDEPKRPEPTLDELRKLIAFFEAGGVSSAAERLGMEQSTLSRQLAVFKEPGAGDRPILVRAGNQLRLTQKGESILPAVRDLVRQYEQLLTFLDGAAEEPQIVRLGVGHFAMQHYLSRALAQLRKQDCRVSVESHIARGQDRILGVARGDFDLAIVTHDPLQIDTILAVHLPKEKRVELSSQPLVEQPFCVVAHKTSLPAQEMASLPPRRPVTAQTLCRWPLVGLDRDSGIRRLIQRKLRKVDAELQFVPRTGTGGWPAARELARQGLGVAVLPLAALSDADFADLTVRRLSDVAIHDYLIHRPQELNGAQAEVKDCLIQAARTHQAAMLKVWDGLRT